MNKILFPLFLITTTIATIRLNAYCVYNWSNNETISVFIFESKSDAEFAPLLRKKTHYVLSPNGGRGCWHWKSIDQNNRKKEWYWEAFEGGKKIRTIWTDKLGAGYFPIGGTIVFAGYDKNGKAKFKLNYDGKPWEYRKSPWNHRSQPWTTYKR